MPMPGRSNGGKPDGGFDRAREERIKRRLLVDPISDSVGKIKVLLLRRFVRPRQPSHLLRNRTSDVDQLGVGAVPAIEPTAFGHEIGRYLLGQDLWRRVPNTHIR